MEVLEVTKQQGFVASIRLCNCSDIHAQAMASRGWSCNDINLNPNENFIDAIAIIFKWSQRLTNSDQHLSEEGSVTF